MVFHDTKDSLPSLEDDEIYDCRTQLDSVYESELSDQEFFDASHTEGVNGQTKVSK